MPIFFDSSKLVEYMKGMTEKQVARLSLNIISELVRTTPVDTGLAKSNWIPTYGAPYSSVVGTKAKVNDRIQGSKRGVLGRYKFKFGPIYITNNVPYIGLLNQGRSSQAPPGFVEAAIWRGIRQAQLNSTFNAEED